MILVTGATGTVGREVVKHLVEQKQAVRAMTRDASKAKFGPGVEVVSGDFDRPETIAKALAGVQKVFLLSTGPAVSKHDATMAQAMKAAGLKRVVKLSAISVATHPQQLIAQWHGAGEQALKDAGLAWTFLRPGGFMTNAYNWIHNIKTAGKVFAPAANGKNAPIDPRDIAAVAVRALLTDGHEGKAYAMSGPILLTMAEQVAQLSAAIGKPLTYVDVPESAAREAMSKNGMPAVMIDAIMELMAVVRAGEGEHVYTTVQEILGRGARDFATWSKEHRAAFLA